MRPLIVQNQPAAGEPDGQMQQVQKDVAEEWSLARHGQFAQAFFQHDPAAAVHVADRLRGTGPEISLFVALRLETNSLAVILDDDDVRRSRHVSTMILVSFRAATGNLTVTVVPVPGVLAMSIVPPWSWTIRYATARPNPLPLVFVV